VELLKERPQILQHMIGTSLENLTVSTGGVAGEQRCFADPGPLDLSAITAGITVWHGGAGQVALLSDLRESLAGLQYEERIFAEHGSLILYECWNQVLAHLASI
jgi:hypothetical protein